MQNPFTSDPATLPDRTDVLIVGAGPTGLALAISLQQAGVDHVLIDKLTANQNTSRAAVIHAHTLEMLEEVGVTRELISRGLRIDTFSVRSRDRALLRIRFDELPSVHNFLLMVPQDVAEVILGDRLAALGGHIRRGVSAVSAKQMVDRATVTVESGGVSRSIKARYVVGADGMHSMVRAAAQIDFDGYAYADSFVLADVAMDWELGDIEVSLFLSPDGLVVVAPLPGGAYRIVATMDQAPERPTTADVQSILDTRGPALMTKTVKQVLWSSRFRIHHRVARTYRNNRLFVMGDAAHVHSPAGGQGMNTGLVDAVVLGRMLADVIKGTKPESALDNYECLRRPAARTVVAMAGRLTDAATLRGSVKESARNLVFSAINALRPARRALAMNLSGLSRKKFAHDAVNLQKHLSPADSANIANHGPLRKSRSA